MIYDAINIVGTGAFADPNDAKARLIALEIQALAPSLPPRFKSR
jgi:hypothetical protein